MALAKLLSLLLVVTLAIYNSSEERAAKPPLGAAAQKWWNMATEDVKRMLGHPSKSPNRAKNVVFFLGDGMGITTTTAARNFKAQLAGKLAGEDKLTFDSFPYTGFSRTYTVDHQVTDSAASATAYLCGVKANYGTVGVDERVMRQDCDGYIKLKQQNPEVDLKCIAEFAKEAGMMTGVVTVMPIVDASPSPLFVHSAYRDWASDANMTAQDIARGCKDLAIQFVEQSKHIDFIMGGGRIYFEKEYRKDKRDLDKEWAANWEKDGKKAAVVKTRDALLALDLKSYDKVLGLYNGKEMNYDKERETFEPTLTEMAERAIEFLKAKSGDRGFFLWVEGGLIDYAHHENFAALALYDTLALDAAINRSLSLLPEDTIAIVTADHSHSLVYSGYPKRDISILDITDKDSKLWGLDGKPYVPIMYGNGPGYYHNLRNFTKSDGRVQEERRNLSDPREPFDPKNLRYQSFSILPIKYESHGGEDVGIYATGPGSYLFSGVHEQNAIPHLLYCAACFGPYHPDCPCSSEGGEGLPMWAIIAIAMGGVIVLLVLVIVIMLIVIGTKKRRPSSASVLPLVSKNRDQSAGGTTAQA